MTIIQSNRAVRHSALAVTIIGLALLVRLPAAHAQTETGTINSGQFNLDYRIEGTGTPAIVIGFPNYYSNVFSKELRSHLRLVFVDHRGTAPSPGEVPLSEYSLEQISDDIELVRSELELGPIVIIGHSGHGLMALEYAKRYPESVSHVVVIGISPDLSDESRSQSDMYWDELASTERKAALEKNWEGVPEEEPEDTYPGENFIKAYVRSCLGDTACGDRHYTESRSARQAGFACSWEIRFSDCTALVLEPAKAQVQELNDASLRAKWAYAPV